MIVKRAAVLLAASALAGCTAVKTALSPLGEIIGPDSMAEQYVSVRTVPLYSEPSGFSAVVTNLEYSSQVRVLQYVSKVPAVFVEQPVSSNSIPRWVEVEFAGMTGYVPERVLVDKNQMRDQGNGEDGSEMATIAAMVSAKAFSGIEDIGDDMPAMGMFDKAELAVKSDLQAMTNLVASVNPPDAASVVAFRNEGGLSPRLETIRIDTPFVEETNVVSYLKGTAVKVIRVAGKMGSDLADENPDNELLKHAKNVYSSFGPVQEFQLGQVVGSRMIVGKRVLPVDDSRSVYVNMVGNVLVLSSNDPVSYRGHRFFVIEDKTPNAYCLSGGIMFVTTGMLGLMRDEDELAAVLAHEMAHQELRHGAQSLQKTSLIAIMSMAKGFERHKAGSTKGKDIALELLYAYCNRIYDNMLLEVRNGYGKESESEADARALQICAIAGYDPRAIRDVVERFKSEFGSYGGAAYPDERGAELAQMLERCGFAGGADANRNARSDRFCRAMGRTR